MVKKDQLYAIVLMKRRQILNVLFKMVAMATSHTLLRFQCKAGIDGNNVSNSCSFIKQDLTFKQAHPVSFCFVLCSEFKF